MDIISNSDIEDEKSKNIWADKWLKNVYILINIIDFYRYENRFQRFIKGKQNKIATINKEWKF